ncbi:hypothetical protein FHETE_5151 [Fusarium heterosporum]|uniref:Uncharacterized protein n=1 Tax=Fusarium heterosporum TaxID=42747 RepID=A0A8H5WS18_FUSHE|nr:hypothetical protein FHETE_5151 [Fusarium heterosporum]
MDDWHKPINKFIGLSAVFAETENPELNQVLTQIQEKIILPAYLPEAQRKLVYNKKKSDYIQRNPVVIELDGLEHTFKTIDRFNDVPNSGKAYLEATLLMQTKEEWDNLGTLLAGYKKAGIRLKRQQYDAAIRRAGKHRQPYAIIECAKQAQKTGFLLNNTSSAALLLASVNIKITKPTGEESEVQEALKWNQLVWDLLQRPEHLRDGASPREQPHFNPAIRGLILYAQTSAVKEQQTAEASVERLIRDVRDNVEFITSAWKDQLSKPLTKSPYLNHVNPRTEALDRQNMQHISPYYYVHLVAQNIKGIELAQEIIGDDAKDLTPVRDALEQNLEEFIRADANTGAKRNMAGWGNAYEDVTGRKPTWADALPAQ